MEELLVLAILRTVFVFYVFSIIFVDIFPVSVYVVS